MEVGKQLRAVRTAFGLSQRELAKRAGVTNGMVSLENPVCIPDDDGGVLYT